MPNRQIPSQYRQISAEILAELQQIVGKSYVFIDDETRKTFSKDYTEDLEFYPEVVIKPSTAQQVADILKVCNKNNIPVTPRGAGTGLSGGALPVYGGVSLSMERFNKIIEIEPFFR